jgi:hypothetical protein
MGALSLCMNVAMVSQRIALDESRQLYQRLDCQALAVVLQETQVTRQAHVHSQTMCGDAD